MSNDMTYSEIIFIRTNISEFIEKIIALAEIEKYEMNQYDKEFFIFISKHIIFFKYLYLGMGNLYFYRVLISDLYYYILSIIRNEIRYIYVNQRSIIENCTRAIINKTVESNYITEEIFLQMKNKIYLFDFTDDEYSLIKSEYSTACGYIHGGNILNDNLSYVLNECLENKVSFKDKNKYYIRIINILKTYDKMLISEYAESISGCFHREKTLLKYLIGEECVSMLFKILYKRDSVSVT